MGDRNAEAILNLLDKIPDTYKLEKLLETQNLIKLSGIYGFSPDYVKNQLMKSIIRNALNDFTLRTTRNNLHVTRKP